MRGCVIVVIILMVLGNNGTGKNGTGKNGTGINGTGKNGTGKNGTMFSLGKNGTQGSEPFFRSLLIPNLT